ncbi:MAG: glycoside hydrolase family 97 protein [Fimbriimonadia bacterium]|jgi:alpha-glucosidase
MNLSLFTAILMAANEAPADIAVCSPDESLRIELGLGPPFAYSVYLEGRPVVLESPIRMEFEGALTLGAEPVLTAVTRSRISREWETVCGKSKRVRDECNEMRASFREASGLTFDVVVRAYDDGVAFRVFLPRQQGMERFTLLREDTEFRFDGNPTVWAAHHGSYVSHQESEYAKGSMRDLKSTDIIGMPLLVRTERAYVAITEAELTDWAGMYVCGSSSDDRAEVSAVRTILSPLPSGEGLVVARTPHYSPWRVLMIGRNPGVLIESNIILNLSRPCAIEDTSWIRPGMSAWDHWWTGDAKMDMETNKLYIDFAAEMGWPYQLVDWQWYGEPDKPDSDVTRVIPQIDMAELTRYAKEKGVRLWLWTWWSDLDRKLDEAFALYEKWGIAGVKIDFMQRDDQEMVNWYEKVVRKAAKHRLMIDFHGAYKPTGLRRTYPNLMTREGVLGNEYNKFSTRCTPEHKVTLPFTRMLCGPMDYTPGGFLNRTPEQFRMGSPTQVIGTRANELALFVVYESPYMCACDHPSHYRGQPGLEFLRSMPTTWDETRYLSGQVGEYIVLARRSGDEWYIGAMTDSKARDLDVPLRVLGKGRYSAHIYRDAPDADKHPERLVVEERSVTSSDAIKLTLAPCGGAAVRLARVP